MERITKFFGADFKSTLSATDVEPFTQSAQSVVTTLKIWPPEYEPSWHYYQIHQANYWSANEHEPLEDTNGFIKMERGWQNALLQSFAVLAIGDDAVMRFIDENDYSWRETTLWMFKDQGARETVHKIVYNRMLQLAEYSTDFTVNMLTSDEYVEYILGEEKIDAGLLEECERNEVMKKACFLIKMILCERYLFAAPFLIINLMGESGYINNCVKINMQVMKDEHVHYLHAVQLYHDLKLDHPEEKQAIDALFGTLATEFTLKVEGMVSKLGLGLDQKYVRGVMDHTRFTLQTIYADSGLPVPERLLPYTSTPFSVFDKNTGADKFNLMESNSTVYKAVRATYVPDWSDLKEEEEPEIVVVECKLKRKRTE